MGCVSQLIIHTEHIYQLDVTFCGWNEGLHHVVASGNGWDWTLKLYTFYCFLSLNIKLC